MHSKELLHTLLLNALPDVHTKRINAVINATESLLIGKELTLSQLGRNMPGASKERHNIRKIDRLLCNHHLHGELILFYRAKIKSLISKTKMAIISVDWSATDKRKDFHILRASISLKGRGEVIYQEVHEDCQLNNHEIHEIFLCRLRSIIPKEVRVVIITDAGFCNPWFKACETFGFDWIGRTKSTIQYTPLNKERWKNCGKVYEKAKNNKAQFVGECYLAKTNKLRCHIVTYKEKPKGRIRQTRSGKKCQSSHSQRIAKRQRTPWVLVTSLRAEEVSALEIVRYYKKRMQIEESFRDTKSTRYGFSLRHCLSKDKKRIEVLLLIAMLATWICWLLTLDARAKNKHYDYQANTIRDHVVLSAVYLGCQLVRRGYQITLDEAQQALEKLRSLIRESVQCQ